MASSWNALKDSFNESTKDAVKYQNSAAPTRFLLYEARLISVKRLERSGTITGLATADQLWVKFVGYSRRLQKRFRHTFHSWLSCWSGEVLSDFGKIVEAATGDMPQGYMTVEAARLFAEQLSKAVSTSELYAKVLFRKFKPGDRYLPGREIESIKIIEDAVPSETLTKSACDSDKTLLWNIHPDLFSKNDYLIFRNDNTIREFGHCLPEFEGIHDDDSYETTKDDDDDDD